MSLERGTVDLGEIPFDRQEILRYAQMPAAARVPEELPLDKCLEEARGAGQCRAVWARYAVSRREEELDLGFARTCSRSLRKHLEGCGQVLLFACTAGSEMDRRINRNKLISPVRGLLMSAIGSQQAEGACDRLCAYLTELFPGWELTDRFSPGYGDLPLEMQRAVFETLDCERAVGITLTDSLLMRPTKSVTALIGMKERIKA